MLTPLFLRVLVVLFITIILPAPLLAAPARQATSAPVTVVTVEPDVWLPNVKRMGINLGAPDRFGAGQYLKNLINNPGFEAGEFASLVFVADGATPDQFQQDNWDVAWNSDGVGQPEGFWDGAYYEVLSGRQKGSSGTIAAFEHRDGRYTYRLAPPEQASAGATTDETTFGNEDLVLLRKQVTGFEGDSHPFARGDSDQRRPGSPGTQSLLLRPSDSGWEPSFRYFMDSLWRDADLTAGKLFIVDGNWHFEIWARGSSNRDVLEVAFQRDGGPVFMSETFDLTTSWQRYTHQFFVPDGLDVRTRDDGESAQVLTVDFRIAADSDGVWIDDAILESRDHRNPTVFSDILVTRLQELRPGILRNWGNQLGSSLENQLAPAPARKTTGFSPRASAPVLYDYSLHEFLELARHINTEPWYVIPPTWTESELEGLMAYLAAPAGSNVWADMRSDLGQEQPWTDVFPVIHLEFGNELWGGNAGDDPFIGATMRGGERVGEVADQRIGTMKQTPWYTARPSEFNFIIGGQFGFPERQAQIEAASDQHDALALSPYFGELDFFSNDSEMFYPLFARPYQDVQFGELAQSRDALDGQTELSIYEINFHSTRGDAPLSVRNGFVTGLNGGIALPLYMLNYQKWLGIRNQCAFVAVQYAFRMENGDYVRVWGMLRDLEATGRKRPTWLGLELANRAISGNLLSTVHSGANPSWLQQPINGITAPVEVPYVQSFAYGNGTRYAIVLFNLHLEQAQRVVVQTPNLPDPAAVLHQLASESIHHTNESDPLIRIQSRQLRDFSQSYELTLPPHSMQVIEWNSSGTPVRYQQPTATAPPAPLPTRVITDTLPQTPSQVATPVIVTQTITTTNEVAVVLTSTPAASVIGGETPGDVIYNWGRSTRNVPLNNTLLFILGLIGVFNLVIVVVGIYYGVRRLRR